MRSSLIIFVKNPELGKVKTRLANAIGEEAALAIYLRLLNHTCQVVKQINVDKTVYYSNYIDTEDHWDQKLFSKSLQNGNDLGEKMKNAFTDQFERGYGKVVIIGSDNAEITPEVITKAFDILDGTDTVFGPAKDGGYYLLGLKYLVEEIFIDISWGTEKVLDQSLQVLNSKNIPYELLPVLNDIDTLDDLRNFPHLEP